jgi:predicted transcriptional regulator
MTEGKPTFFPKALYRRWLTSRIISKVKHFNCIASRCEKTDKNYRPFVALIRHSILI